MYKRKRYEALSAIFLILAILSAFMIFFEILYWILYELDTEVLVTLIVCPILSLIFGVLFILYRKKTPIKYLYIGKKIKQQIADKAKNFKNASDEFLKEFKEYCEDNYHSYGQIFLTDNAEWYLSDARNQEACDGVYKMLCKCIKTKGGFHEFCESLQKKVAEEIEKYGAGDFGYQYIIPAFSNQIVSDELHYLMNKVFQKTGFNLSDNGVSEKFSERNKKLIREIDEIYSPVLFGFEDEIKKLATKKHAK